MAWGLSLIGTKAQIDTAAVQRALALADTQASADNEFAQVDAVEAFLGKLLSSLPDSQQLIISASGDLVGDRGEIRVVVTVSPAPPPAPVAAPDSAAQPDGSPS